MITKSSIMVPINNKSQSPHDCFLFHLLLCWHSSIHQNLGTMPALPQFAMMQLGSLSTMDQNYPPNLTLEQSLLPIALQHSPPLPCSNPVLCATLPAAAQGQGTNGSQSCPAATSQYVALAH